MNGRERVNRIMHYQDVDRPPVWSVEGVAEGAVRRWIKDGTFPEGMSVGDVVRMDGHELVELDTDPLPAFVAHTIEENDHWRTEIDRYGFTVRALKEQNVSPRIYYYTAGCVATRDDWRRLQERYNPDDSLRKPRAWGPELWNHLNTATAPVSLRIDWGPGRGAKNGYAMGLELFLETLMDDPGFAKEMLDFWADFVIAIARDWFAHVHFDFVAFNEDGMGYKNSTLVSPAMYKAIWLPAMRKVVDFLHSQGVDIIAYYSSGNLRPLMPTLLDIGVNLYFPLEVAAGMDALALRREFGRDMRLIGNIARQALMDGPEAIDQEFQRKAPPLLADGGYIPAVDDMIAPDMTLKSYQYYTELVRNYRL